jgi:hypothetical protein
VAAVIQVFAKSSCDMSFVLLRGFQQEGNITFTIFRTVPIFLHIPVLVTPKSTQKIQDCES